ncbi:DASS family sodium-coupled anion symporter [Weeksellaceae bacterium TAE3-ERU29]|nr:DASS family sodium-coupled anion symporter [Weeksellaceae bacterium TAE3-ERU29]
MSILKSRNFIISITSLVLFFVLIYSLPFTNTENKGLALLALVAILWLTEAVHVTITALIVPIIGVLLGLVKTDLALAAFSDPTIFLFFGGFALSTALHMQGLDKMIANKMVALSGGNFFLAIILLFVVTAVLSMGISNTATTAMMLPLALGLLSNLKFEDNKSTYIFVLLGIAYSANIGGVGTLVGSPPNAIVASQMDLSFADWLKYGIPVMLILLPIMIVVLILIFRPKLKYKVEIENPDYKLNSKQILTIVIFAFMALSWVFSKQVNVYVSQFLNIDKIEKFDSVIALLGVILICGTRIAHWKDVQKNTDWGVLMLFGGGLTLSSILTDSGASKILVEGIVFIIEGRHFYLIGLIVATFIIFLTEFTSNTASAALLVPIFISIARALGMDPLGLSMIIGLGASCAFMMPVATPPNALAYGTGFVEQKYMLRAGVILNLICVLIIGTIAYVFWFH